MEVVWKRNLGVADVQEIEVPEGSELVCVREQGVDICIWYRCNPNHPPTKWRIAIINTGQAIPEDAEYLGTAIQAEGKLVWHVFALWPDETA